ncbi:NifB/NifX family molybdenum-iron cluster-binding protein [Agarivorans sp. MS3-6]
MIIAIPVNNDKLAGHFTKAMSFSFYDGAGVLLASRANPSLNEGCHGKKQILDLFDRYKVERVLIKNIGDKMLSKLLAKDLMVFQTHGRLASVDALFQPEQVSLHQLCLATEGRPSSNASKQQACCQKSGRQGKHTGCCKH